MKLKLGEVADWIHAEGDFSTDLDVVGYSIDSRTIGAGELFFAVTGERVNGHDFVATALANGAVAAVVSQHWLAPGEMDACRLLRVPESEDCVLRALQTLAHRVRQRWGKRVIGVTGSAGKTTTKEAVATVLAAKFRVLKSEGNLNNHFGLPLQLLKLEPEHDVAVLEMGMNHAGEIARLAKIAEPDWAVVTNVAPVHLEHFEAGIGGVAAAKRELVEALPPEGLAVLNFDDERVAAFARGRAEHVMFYGTRKGADLRAETVKDMGADGVAFGRSSWDGCTGGSRRRARDRAAAPAWAAQRFECAGGNRGRGAQRDPTRGVCPGAGRTSSGGEAGRGAGVEGSAADQRLLQFESAGAELHGRRVAGGAQLPSYRDCRRDAGARPRRRVAARRLRRADGGAQGEYCGGSARDGGGSGGLGA